MALAQVVFAITRLLIGAAMAITGTEGTEVLNAAPPTFDFFNLAIGLAAVSFGLSGALMAGAALFPDASEKAKRSWIPTTIMGLVVVGVSAFLITILTPTP